MTGTLSFGWGKAYVTLNVEKKFETYFEKLTLRYSDKKAKTKIAFGVKFKQNNIDERTNDI